MHVVFGVNLETSIMRSKSYVGLERHERRVEKFASLVFANYLSVCRPSSDSDRMPISATSETFRIFCASWCERKGSDHVFRPSCFSALRPTLRLDAAVLLSIVTGA